MTKHHTPRPMRELPAGTSGLPIVAIVGRPNVGKSTLFNRLAKERIAIVHDEPGVTRDRHYADTLGFGVEYTLLDTGGFDPEDVDPMRAGIARHVKAAIREADVIVFVTDGAIELNDADRAGVELLRRSDKPVLFAANKADSPKIDAQGAELYKYGAKNVFMISALHGRGIAELEAAIVEALPPSPPVDEDRMEGVARITVVGRPNAGKSSLTNVVLGEDRMMVSEVAGTTRDAISAWVERGQKRYVWTDTAGIRKRSRVTKADDDVEAMGVYQAIRGMERTDIVVLMVDAKEGVAEQDAKIMGLAQDRGKAMIIVLNKTDLLSDAERKAIEVATREKISFAPYVPILHLSTKTNKGLGTLFRTIDETFVAFHKRVTTGELNRFFAQVIETQPPPTSGGKSPRLYYLTQAESRPPTFIVMSNAPESIHFSYRRYVVNQLRERFGFGGVPVRVFYKGKKKRPGEGELPPRNKLEPRRSKMK